MSQLEVVNKRTRRKLTPKDRVDEKLAAVERLEAKAKAARVKYEAMVKEAREAAQAQLDALPK